MAGLRGSVRVVVVCLSDEEDQAAELKKAAGSIPVYFYDGKPKPCTPIVRIYEGALREIDADFFVFAHQAVRGDIQAWVETGLQYLHRRDVLALIGWRPGLQTLWRDTVEPTPVSTCDECCFGFYRASGLTFDPKLQWTNYSQEICLQASAHDGIALVVPNNLGHAQHRYGPWFVKSGIYQKERAYVLSKWRGVVENPASGKCRFTPLRAVPGQAFARPRSALPEPPLKPKGS